MSCKMLQALSSSLLSFLRYIGQHTDDTWAAMASAALLDCSCSGSSPIVATNSRTKYQALHIAYRWVAGLVVTFIFA